jgi:hypothetical protein
VLLEEIIDEVSAMSDPKMKQSVAHSHVSPKTPVLQYTSLAAYFHEQVVAARSDQGLAATQPAEFYVVTMLESFSHADTLFRADEAGKRDTEALAQILHRAVFETTPGKQLDHYRRLGDLALYLSGLFADSLRRTSVGLSYYVSMGQGAYATLAHHGQNTNAALREIFLELSVSFAGWVEVLRQLGEEFGFASPPPGQETLELFERWQLAPASRSANLSGELMKRGILPSRLIIA